MKNRIILKPNHQYRGTQSGRSMVEMLGTLAIMGVLTIGGIAGYRYAINKSNSNTILNAVSQMAVTASTELTTQGNLTLPEWKDASGNLTINGAYGVTTERYDDGAFGITVSNINDEVCDRIKGMDWKIPEDIIINTTDACDGGESNTIEFVFNNTLKTGNTSGSDDDLKSCSSQTECPYCHTCTGGKCVPDTLCDNSCPSDKPVLTANGKCIACPTSFSGGLSFSVASQEDCEKCSFNGRAYKFSGNSCYLDDDCPEGYFYFYTHKRCESCETQDYTHHQSHEENLKCVEQCNGIRVLTSAGGWGESCDKPCTGEGRFYDGWGYCQNCATSTGYWGSSSCNKCPGKTFVNVKYYDRCELLNDCPEGQHLGACCGDGEVFIQTNTVRAYSGSATYSEGVCCPQTRPNWNGSKCMP